MLPLKMDFTLPKIAEISDPERATLKVLTPAVAMQIGEGRSQMQVE